MFVVKYLENYAMSPKEWASDAHGVPKYVCMYLLL